jgi:hypothetical protein
MSSLALLIYFYFSLSRDVILYPQSPVPSVSFGFVWQLWKVLRVLTCLFENIVRCSNMTCRPSSRLPLTCIRQSRRNFVRFRLVLIASSHYMTCRTYATVSSACRRGLQSDTVRTVTTPSRDLSSDCCVTKSQERLPIDSLILKVFGVVCCR